MKLLLPFFFMILVAAKSVESQPFQLTKDRSFASMLPATYEMVQRRFPGYFNRSIKEESLSTMERWLYSRLRDSYAWSREADQDDLNLTASQRYIDAEAVAELLDWTRNREDAEHFVNSTEQKLSLFHHHLYVLVRKHLLEDPRRNYNVESARAELKELWSAYANMTALERIYRIFRMVQGIEPDRDFPPQLRGEHPPHDHRDRVGSSH